MPLAKSGLGAGFNASGRAARVADATLSDTETRPAWARALIGGPKYVAAALRVVGE